MNAFSQSSRRTVRRPVEQSTMRHACAHPRILRVSSLHPLQLCCQSPCCAHLHAVAMAHRALPACPPARLSTSACAGLRQQLSGVRVVTCRPRRAARLPREALRARSFFFGGRKEAPADGAPPPPQPSSCLALAAAAAAVPHPDKQAKGGEDAHCLCVSALGGVLALADGVSGYADLGVDSAAYSRRLMRCVADAAALAEAAGQAANPLAMLTAAHASTRVAGASTAVLCALDGAARQLNSLNLGDSGFLLIRDGAVSFASPAQSHSFDCPYQLGCEKYVPDTDTADMGDTRALAVQPGDLLIMASDGLFDNLKPEEVLALANAAAVGLNGDVSTGTTGFDVAQRVATSLAAAAATRSRDPSCDSPFAAASRKEAQAQRGTGAMGMLSAAFSGRDWQTKGGKLDDVTVVAAVVVDAAKGAEALSASAAAAAAQRLTVLSAVGDAQAEARAVLLGCTEEDEADALARRLEAKAAEKRAGAASRLPQLSAQQVAGMDAQEVRRALAAAGLPTSGKLETLRARLLNTD